MMAFFEDGAVQVRLTRESPATAVTPVTWAGSCAAAWAAALAAACSMAFWKASMRSEKNPLL
ncbi:hypothetical protein LR393_27625 [Kineosporia mesophila]|uniref:hypothetical protein n=1 Tax=Kineosporia mesophila TaxID=566012 RepID=UPI001E470D90|nr:hypothetical protein [Kineosporia mesophila]MCD5353850.1 hypothetical protein [Kineosporia mesophila]